MKRQTGGGVNRQTGQEKDRWRNKERESWTHKETDRWRDSAVTDFVGVIAQCEQQRELSDLSKHCLCSKSLLNSRISVCSCDEKREA